MHVGVDYALCKDSARIARGYDGRCFVGGLGACGVRRCQRERIGFIVERHRGRRRALSRAVAGTGSRTRASTYACTGPGTFAVADAGRCAFR